jgi:hypothetical protein
VPICAALASVSVLAIPRDAIDHIKARGLEDSAAAARAEPSLLRTLLACPGLATFACLFHFANAPMLPLVGQKLALAHKSEATALMSACVIAAQLVMLPMAVISPATVTALAVSRSAWSLSRYCPSAACSIRSPTIRFGWWASRSWTGWAPGCSGR